MEHRMEEERGHVMPSSSAGMSFCRHLSRWTRTATNRVMEMTYRACASVSDDGASLSGLFNLTGSVAFVTGGGRGIGKHTCLTLARAGADVMVTDYSDDTHEKCKDLVKEIRSLGRRSLSCVCDVRYPESVDRAMAKCKDRMGKLDILVANAGILGEMTIPEEIDAEEWRRVFATNVDGVFHCCRAAYPIMKENGRGKVIIMSSISRPGMHTIAAFSSSKAAVIPLAKSLAVAWAPFNIQVNCILPGAVDTDFSVPLMEDAGQKRQLVESIPSRRLALPKDIVGAILFFASPASDYCTGSQLVVDGGVSANS